MRQPLRNSLAEQILQDIRELLDGGIAARLRPESVILVISMGARRIHQGNPSQHLARPCASFPRFHRKHPAIGGHHHARLLGVFGEHEIAGITKNVAVEIRLRIPLILAGGRNEDARLVAKVADGYAQTFCETLNNAGFDAEPFEMDMSDRATIKALVARACELGPVTALVNGAGVSPSQAPIEAILKVDLYGTAALLEEVGAVIEAGGVGVTISSQSGKRMPQLTAEEDRLLATTPAENGIAPRQTHPTAQASPEPPARRAAGARQAPGPAHEIRNIRATHPLAALLE